MKFLTKKRVIISSSIMFLGILVVTIFLIVVNNKDTYLYVLNNSKEYYIIEKAFGNHEEYVIESTYNDLPVKEIGDRSFENKSRLKRVIFKEDTNVNFIGRRAFNNCKSLTEFTIPNSVEVIYNNAFYDCVNLTTIIISPTSNLKHIAGSAFFNCNLLDIFLPDSLLDIGSFAFFNNKSLTQITLPRNLKNLYSEAFYGCDKLKTIYDNTLNCRFYTNWDYDLEDYIIIKGE